MASSIDASTSGAGGVITTADNTGILNLKTAGTNAVTIDASQNVGIGTTSPQNDAGYKTLTVNGTSGGQVSFKTNDANIGSIYSVSTALNLTTGTSIPMVFQTNGSERMRIDSSGNVTVATGSITATTLDVVAGRYIVSSNGVFFNNDKAVTCVTTNVWYNIGFPAPTTGGLFAFRDGSRGGTAVFRADTSQGAVSISNGITGFEMQWVGGGTQQMQIRVTSGSNISIRIACLSTNLG